MLHCNVQKITKKAASRRGPGSHSPIGRTVPPEEYTEYHENVLQSYRYKQLNARSHCYFLVVITYRGALPVEAIRRHRMQENPSALPRTPLGAYSAPKPLPAGREGLAAPPQEPHPFRPRVSALLASPLLSPHYKTSFDAAGFEPCFLCPSVPHIWLKLATPRLKTTKLQLQTQNL